MTPEDREAWLRANTITCPEFGRIPPSQCESLRARPEKPGEVVYPPGKLPLLKPKACMECREWPELCGTKNQEETMAKKIEPCKRCSLKRKVNGRGLCSSCYATASKKGELNKYPLDPDPPAEPDLQPVESPEPQTGIISLDFTDHSDLLRQLTSRANKQFRTIENQIMWEVSQATQDNARDT